VILIIRYSVTTDNNMDELVSRKQLTERQREVLKYVMEFQEEMGRAPTGPEIATHFGFKDHSSAYQHIKLLAKKGYVEFLQFGRGRPTGIRLAKSAEQLLDPSWPLLGDIPAGPLSEVLVEGSRKVRQLQDLIPNLQPGDYFLVVNGDSMIEAGLQSGNYVVVRPKMQPQQGDICAVWVDGEGGTLKYVYFENNSVRLCPANSRYQDRTYLADQVRIQGVLVASFAVQSFKQMTREKGRSMSSPMAA
jgi:repressor LexA